MDLLGGDSNDFAKFAFAKLSFLRLTKQFHSFLPSLRGSLQGLTKQSIENANFINTTELQKDSKNFTESSDSILFL